MIDNCCLCNIILYENAHVVARRNFEKCIDDRLQNIIPLCPTCHTIFDEGFITIHPKYKIFVFSLIRSRKNLFRKFEYSYPHIDVFNKIPQKYLIRQAKFEFKYYYGGYEYELESRFSITPPMKKIYHQYIVK